MIIPPGFGLMIFYAYLAAFFAMGVLIAVAM